MRLHYAFSSVDPLSRSIHPKLLDAMECSESGESRWQCGGSVVASLWGSDTPYLEELDEVEADVHVVVSRHEGRSGAVLTVHHTGNPTREPRLGGEPLKLAKAEPRVAAALVRLLLEAKPTNYQVVMEATHHGPTKPEKPIVFIEVGSSPENWLDPNAQKAILHALLSLPKKLGELSGGTRVAWFGGLHYAERATRRVASHEMAVGHIVAKRSLQELSQEELRVVVGQAIDRTIGAEAVVVEKLPSRIREVIVDEARRRGLEVKRL